MSLSMPNANTTTSVTMPPDREALSLMANLKLDRFKLGKQKFDEEYAEIMKKNNDATLSLLDKVQMLNQYIDFECFAGTFSSTIHESDCWW
ncbi:unnamed protein product [Rotaria socialis]|uniref:Uncharacterized protein n=2 Tax=Rotaria socialis TaxID=392032 RepID=A0A818TDH7_9BILA|nr:unnamed protein product [Rotaria socialis]